MNRVLLIKSQRQENLNAIGEYLAENHKELLTNTLSTEFRSRPSGAFSSGQRAIKEIKLVYTRNLELDIEEILQTLEALGLLPDFVEVVRRDET